MNKTCILIAGEGGQGIQTIAKILADLGYQSNFEVSYMPHYGVEMRMGISLAYLQISNKEIIYPKFQIADIVAVTTKRDLKIPKSFIDKHSTIVNCINMQKILQENNLPTKTLNMLCLGILIKELDIRNIKFNDQMTREIVGKTLGYKEGIDLNLLAIQIGQKMDAQTYSLSLEQIEKDKFELIIQEDVKKIHQCFPNLCKGCGLCIEQCPVKALSWSKDKLNFISRPMPEVNLEKCIACGICQQVCPDCAIRITRK